MLVWTSLVYCVPSVYGLYAHQVCDYYNTKNVICDNGSPAEVVVFPPVGSFAEIYSGNNYSVS